MPAIFVAVLLSASASAEPSRPPLLFCPAPTTPTPSKAPAPAAKPPKPKPGPVFHESAVAPYFPSGPLAKAAAALDDGDDAAALKLIPKAVRGSPARFLRALADLGAGDPETAAKELEKLAPLAPPLAARCHCLAAQGFTAAEDWAGAARNELACAADPVLGKLARVEHAKLLWKLGRRKQATRELMALVHEKTPALDGALFALGTVLESRGQARAALLTWRRIYLDDPASPLAAQAKKRALAVYRQARLPPPTAARLARRVEKLLQAGRLRAAIAQLRAIHVKPLCTGATCPQRSCVKGAPAQLDTGSGPLLDPPAPEAALFSLAQASKTETPPGPVALPKCAVHRVEHPASPVSCEVQLLRGLAAKRVRANSVALDLLFPVYARCADEAVRERAAFAAAGAALALHDPDAPALAVIAATQFEDQPLSAQALILAADLDRRRDRRAGERSMLRRLVARYPDSPLRPEALFRLFWSHREDGHPERGLGDLATLWKEYDAGPQDDGGDAERGRYWWGRTVAQSAVKKDRARGVGMLARLARDRPLTYYGLLARSYLATLHVEVKPVTGPLYSGPLRLGPLASDPAFALGEELTRLGLDDDARRAFLAVDFPALRADGRRGIEATVVILRLLQSLGDPEDAQLVARRELLKFLRQMNDPLARTAARLAFPFAYRGSVEESAAQAGFAPDFLEGLMREESALNPYALSPVGARGLTQLMPRTARQIARSIGLKRYSTSRLWDPATNIRLGGVYLGRMLKTFGHPGLAAAAYNAGPGAVERWLDSASDVFDEFVEDIPFRETRGYVKRVLRSYAAYRYLYGKRGERGTIVSLALPRDVDP